MHVAINYCSRMNKLLALKLDMSKVYDWVEWGFLRQVMIKLGFDEAWINLIMRCISLVTY